MVVYNIKVSLLAMVYLFKSNFFKITKIITMQKSRRGSFIIGLLVGVLVGAMCLFLFMKFLQQNDMEGDWDERLLFSDTIEKFMGEVEAKKQENETSVYGFVEALSADSITITAQIGNTEKDFTFTITPQTKFYRYDNDEASTLLSADPESIELGSGVTISTDATIGSGQAKTALEILSL
jgi:hypothetical protein